MNASNKAILQEANAAVTRGDNDGFLVHCTEDITWDFVGEQILHGKLAVREYMKTAYTEPPVFDVEDMISENELLTVIGKITLKNEEGKKIAYSYCDVWKFRDGKMAELKAFVIELK